MNYLLAIAGGVLSVCAVSCKFTEEDLNKNVLSREVKRFYDKDFAVMPKWTPMIGTLALFVYRDQEPSVILIDGDAEGNHVERRIECNVNNNSGSNLPHGLVEIYAAGCVKSSHVFRLMASLPLPDRYKIQCSSDPRSRIVNFEVDGDLFRFKKHDNNKKEKLVRVFVSYDTSGELSFAIENKSEKMNWASFFREYLRYSRFIPLPVDVYWYFEIVLDEDVIWDDVVRFINAGFEIVLKHPKVRCRFLMGKDGKPIYRDEMLDSINRDE